MLNCIFVGDVMPGSRIVDDSSDSAVLYDFRNSDLVLGNLESPLTFQKPEKLNMKKIPLWSENRNISLLKEYRFSHLSLNNNHIFDLLDQGLDDTIKILQANKIKGFGISYEGISQIEIVEKKGIRLGIFSVNWVQSHFSKHLFKEIKDIKIEDIKAKVDFVICFLHWGDDHNIYISEDQQETARQLIIDGVDLIIGSHPHVPQGYEVYQGKYIFYSLGNFIFTPKEHYDYLPYYVRYEDERENILFQRLKCKIGFYVKIIFNEEDYTVSDIKPVYREHTTPSVLPREFYSFYKELEDRMNYQVAHSLYNMNEAEKRHILLSYTIPLILRHPIYWPIFLKKLSIGKLLRFMRNKKG